MMHGERSVSFQFLILNYIELINFEVGITAYTQRGHIARATLEATCFQTKAILDAMTKDS